MKKPKDCSICKIIPEREDNEKKINKYKGLLDKLNKSGRYYRGEELQLSTYSLFKCPECGIVYEDAHHYYSDPESTMGLGRDEDEWYNLTRLSIKRAKELLNK